VTFLIGAPCINLLTYLLTYQTSAYQILSLVKINPGYSEIFGRIYADFCPIATKVVNFNSVKSGAIGPNLMNFLINAEKFMPFNLLISE